MKKLLITAASAALFLSGQAGAQSPIAESPSVARAQAIAMADQLFARYDLNHDGVVTRDEAAQVLAQMARGETPKQSRKAERMIDRMFGNAQSVTLSQVEAAAAARAYARVNTPNVANSPSAYAY
jgi:hypothetical protein